MFADGREVLFQKLRAVENLLKTRGYRVAVNSPFAGAMTTPVNICYTALMIEINKKLYLPETEIFAPALPGKSNPYSPVRKPCVKRCKR